jgi:hypothetical protein
MPHFRIVRRYTLCANISTCLIDCNTHKNGKVVEFDSEGKATPRRPRNVIKKRKKLTGTKKPKK